MVQATTPLGQEDDGAGALNPFYTLDAAPYSDVFLLLALSTLLALLAAWFGRPAIEDPKMGG